MEWEDNEYIDPDADIRTDKILNSILEGKRITTAVLNKNNYKSNGADNTSRDSNSYYDYNIYGNQTSVKRSYQQSNYSGDYIDITKENKEQEGYKKKEEYEEKEYEEEEYKEKEYEEEEYKEKEYKEEDYKEYEEYEEDDDYEEEDERNEECENQVNQAMIKFSNVNESRAEAISEIRNENSIESKYNIDVMLEPDNRYELEDASEEELNKFESTSKAKEVLIKTITSLDDLVKIDKNFASNKYTAKFEDEEESAKNKKLQLRDRFCREGNFETFQPHEALELLLYHSLKATEVKAATHNLIDYFGSVANVFDADYHELLKVSGITIDTALLVKTISSFMNLYYSDRCKVGTVLDSSRKYKEFLRHKFIGKSNEQVLILCLDSRSRVKYQYFISEGIANATSVIIRQILEVCFRVNASAVIISHNHPLGLAIPSSEDISTTNRMIRLFKQIGITLIDHVIVCDDMACSISDRLSYA